MQVLIIEKKATFGTRHIAKTNKAKDDTENQKPWMNPAARAGSTVPISNKTLVVLIIVTSAKSVVGDR